VTTGTHSRWLHVVLEGRAVAMAGGEPHSMVGEDEAWPPRGLAGLPGHVLETRLVALTDVAIASIATRALGALERCRPDIAARLTRAGGAILPERLESVTRIADVRLVGVGSDV
jgi:hypothetical protein